MPKRSSRANKSNESTTSANINEKDKVIESFECPHDLKRQLADALKEPAVKNHKNKKDKTRTNNKTEKRSNPKRVLGVFEPNGAQPEFCKLEFANAVRNTIGQNKEEGEKVMTSSVTSEDKNPVCDNKLVSNKKNKDKNNAVVVEKDVMADLLKDIEIIEEEEDDNTWEVVSSCDCSQDDENEEYFHLVDSDDLVATPSDSKVPESNSNKEADKENNNKENKPKSDEPKKQKPKKKILVTRKYIGGPDLPEKLSGLGFKSGLNKAKVEEVDEDDMVRDRNFYQFTHR